MFALTNTLPFHPLIIKIDESQKSTSEKRLQCKKLESTIIQFKSSLQLAIAHIQDPPELAKAAAKLAAEFGTMVDVKPQVEPDIESEFSRHNNFLKRSIQQLQKNLVTETQHGQDTNMLLMKDNLGIISEINSQRGENALLKGIVQAEMGRINALARVMAEKGARKLANLTSAASFPMTELLESNEERIAAAVSNPALVITKNRERIFALRAFIEELERRLNSQQTMLQVSAPKLPTLTLIR